MNGFKYFLAVTAVAAAAVSCLNDSYYELNVTSYSDFEFYGAIQQFGADSVYLEGVFGGGNSSVDIYFNSSRAAQGEPLSGGFALTMKKDSLDADNGYVPFVVTVGDDGEDGDAGSDGESGTGEVYVNQYPQYTAYGTKINSKLGDNICAVFVQAVESTAMPEHDIVFTEPDYGTCTPQMCRINNTQQMVSMMMAETSSARFGQGDWLKLTVTGFLKGEETESVEYYLADFRGEKVDENGVPEPDSLLTKWKNLSLTKLGQVDNIDFTLESSKGDNMMAEPMTFCLDDFVASIYVTR